MQSALMCHPGNAHFQSQLRCDPATSPFTSAGASSALQQTGIQPESIHPRALVRLIQAAQLCCLHRGTSPAEDALRGLLGDRLASACLQAQQQHVQRTCSSFSVDHVGMMPAVSKMSRDGCSSQVHLDRGLYADFILKIRGRQVAVAVEGVSDRLSNMPEVPMATAHVRRRLLSGAGFLVVPISQTEWRRRDHEDRERYVQDCVSSVSAQSASSGGMQ